MTKMWLAVFVVLFSSVWCNSVCGADGCDGPPATLDLGAFISSDGSYAAWTAEVNYGKLRLYEERDTRSEYDLTIASYQVDARGDRFVVRVDDGDIRVGPFVVLPAGFSARFLTGDGPNRLDVWTPALPVSKVGAAKLGVYGWFRAHDGYEPDTWICAALGYGKFCLEYEYDLNRDAGGDYWFANWHAFSW